MLARPKAPPRAVECPLSERTDQTPGCDPEAKRDLTHGEALDSVSGAVEFVEEDRWRRSGDCRSEGARDRRNEIEEFWCRTRRASSIRRGQEGFRPSAGFMPGLRAGRMEIEGPGGNQPSSMRTIGVTGFSRPAGPSRCREGRRGERDPENRVEEGKASPRIASTPSEISARR